MDYVVGKKKDGRKKFFSGLLILTTLQSSRIDKSYKKSYFLANQFTGKFFFSQTGQNGPQAIKLNLSDLPSARRPFSFFNSISTPHNLRKKKCPFSLVSISLRQMDTKNFNSEYNLINKSFSF